MGLKEFKKELYVYFIFLPGYMFLIYLKESLVFKIIKEKLTFDSKNLDLELCELLLNREVSAEFYKGFFDHVAGTALLVSKINNSYLICLLLYFFIFVSTLSGNIFINFITKIFPLNFCNWFVYIILTAVIFQEVLELVQLFSLLETIKSSVGHICEILDYMHSFFADYCGADQNLPIAGADDIPGGSGPLKLILIIVGGLSSIVVLGIYLYG